LDDIHALARTTRSDIVFALPYRTVRERGFAAKGEEPILAIAVETSFTLPVEKFTSLLPKAAIGVSGEIVPSLSDEDYAAIVATFQKNEIEAGNASQVTLSRRFSGRLENFTIDTVFSLYARLLDQIGQYMTVLFSSGEQFLIGATPERHLQITGNETIMNPIAGTLRKEDRGSFPDRLRKFVRDPKEINELFQVLDEEMKMMSLICPDGGRITGPYLREIGAVVHSEYELVGKRGTNTIDALRRTLHAPTVLGSPMQSAARIIDKYEPESRRYYGGEIGIYRCPRSDEPNGDLDSAILIRCAEIFPNGSFHVQSGGGLVRDSVALDEAKESRAKAMGFLAILTQEDKPEPYLTPELRSEVENIFQSRNATLSPFWMNAQSHRYERQDLAGITITIINNEDDFAYMLAHILRSMGASVKVVDNADYDAASYSCDVLLLGPGPGDPSDMSHPVMARLQKIIASATVPMLGVCLGHQSLAVAKGLTVTRQDRSTQGLQLDCQLFDAPHRLGFYNSFSPVIEDTETISDIQLQTDADGRVIAMQGNGFAGFQFHPESVMSQTGYDLLHRAIKRLLNP
jgi:phenazine biosynthesis protein phzE